MILAISVIECTLSCHCFSPMMLQAKKQPVAGPSKPFLGRGVKGGEVFLRSPRKVSSEQLAADTARVCFWSKKFSIFEFANILIPRIYHFNLHQ